MKTSININLFGTLFAIDEDAHQLLTQYLDNMKSYFSKQEGGEEISDDIEHRVAELFWELKQSGNESITIEQVRSIIQEIGNPEEMGGERSSDDKETGGTKTEGETGERKDGQENYRIYGQKIEDTARDTGTKAKDWLSKRRFYRDPQDKLVGGVLSGVAHYFGGGDPIIWRLLFVLLTFFTSGSTILIYILLWICAPEARTAEERLRMQGKEVNPENIKSQVLSDGDASVNTQQRNSGCLGSATGFIALCFKILLVLIAIPILLVIAITVFALLGALFGIIAGLFGAATGITVGGTSLLATILGAGKWPLIALIVAALAFIILFIYTLYRFFHSDRTPTNPLTYIILLALMIISALVCWTSGKKLSQTLHDFNWTEIVKDFDKDYDDSEDYATYRDSIFVVPAFNKVEVQGIGQVIYRKGDSCSVSVKASELLLKHTIIDEQDGLLTITQDDQLGNKSKFRNINLKVYVTAPYITDLKMRGIGTVEIDGNIEQEQPLNVELEGIGAIEIDGMTCPKLYVVNKGAGKVDIEAYVDSLIVSNKGIGAIEIEGRTFNYQRNNDGIGAINDKELKIGM